MLVTLFPLNYEHPNDDDKNQVSYAQDVLNNIKIVMIINNMDIKRSLSALGVA